MRIRVLIAEFWRRVTATRYTRALEAEVVRLRAENRALLNSILGIAGVPPITLPDSAAIGNSPLPSGGRSRRTRSTVSIGNEIAGASAESPKSQSANSVTPMRKRSWHQIYRLLEMDAARKKPQEETSAPPSHL